MRNTITKIRHFFFGKSVIEKWEDEVERFNDHFDVIENMLTNCIIQLNGEIDE